MGHRVLLRRRARRLDLAGQASRRSRRTSRASAAAGSAASRCAGSARSPSRRRRGPCSRRMSTIGSYSSVNHRRGHRPAPEQLLARPSTRGSPRTPRASRAARSATRRRAGSARAISGGSGTRSRNTRSCAFNGRSLITSSRSAPSSRADLGDVRVDVALLQRAGDGHAVMAVAHEVQVADPVDVDRRHRLAALAGLGDPLPAPAGAGRGAEVAVELAAPAVDGPDDRVQRDHLLADVHARRGAERGHDLVERAACARRRRARSAGARPAARGRAAAARGRRRSLRPHVAGRCSSGQTRRNPVAVRLE